MWFFYFSYGIISNLPPDINSKPPRKLTFPNKKMTADIKDNFLIISLFVGVDYTF